MFSNTAWLLWQTGAFGALFPIYSLKGRGCSRPPLTHPFSASEKQIPALRPFLDLKALPFISFLSQLKYSFEHPSDHALFKELLRKHHFGQHFHLEFQGLIGILQQNSQTEQRHHLIPSATPELCSGESETSDMGWLWCTQQDRWAQNTSSKLSLGLSQGQAQGQFLPTANAEECPTHVLNQVCLCQAGTAAFRVHTMLI